MQKIKITVVTYNWPPRNAIGTHRPYHWVKCWSEDKRFDITVLTAKKYAFDEPLDLTLSAPANVTVIEVPYISTIIKVRKFSFNFLKKIKNFLSRFLLRPIDIRNGWISYSQPLIKEIAENTDIVISTYGPAASHILASQIKALNPHCYFIADYRDLWSLNHLSHLTARQRTYERQRELNTIAGKANLLTTVSKELAGQLENLLQIKTLVVPNGFDLNLDEVKQNLTLRKNNTSKLIICYTGRIYIGHRDPTPLFLALEQLITEGKITSNAVEVQIYGTGCEIVDNILRENNSYSQFIRLYGHVDRNTVLKVQKQSSLLLLLESSNPENQGVLTGKVFEYIASGVPILSLGSLKDSAIDELLSTTGTGICVQNDVNLIKKVIMDELEQNNQWFAPKFQEIAGYSRASQSKAFIEEILVQKNYVNNEK